MRYTYTCKHCGTINLNVPVEVRDATPCPGCGGKLKRVFPAPGIIVSVPEAFHTNWSDIAPDTDEAKEDWKKYAVRKR